MSTTVARRYAQAFNEEARSKNLVAKTDADLALIRETLEGSRDLELLFDSPVVSRERKKAVMSGLFKEHVQPLTLSFLNLLVDKRRESMIEEVMAAHTRLRDEQDGIVEAQVRSAMPLDDAGREAVKKQIESLTGKTARISVQVDKALLGGMVVRIGDTVYDGSVSGQLASLRERLHAGSLN